MKDEPTTGPDQPTRLESIRTQWSLLRLAQNPGTASEPARNTLSLRYARAIRKYLGAMVGDGNDADDLAQEALVGILRGKFAQADPGRGRFRDYLKVALRNLVRYHWNQRQRHTTTELEERLAEPASLAHEDVWLATWREALLEQTWLALEHAQQEQPDSVPYTILKLRTERPDDDTAELAKRLSHVTGRTYRPDAARQQLRRARVKFAELLLEEAARTMDDPTPAAVEQELSELGLMEYVRDFLPEDWHAHGELRVQEE